MSVISPNQYAQDVPHTAYTVCKQFFSLPTYISTVLEEAICIMLELITLLLHAFKKKYSLLQCALQYQPAQREVTT